MSHLNLRKRARISYFEPDEPNADEYIFCTECGDTEYEYCSIHGALLVIPDDKVPPSSEYPLCVPRAAMTVPQVFLHITDSTIPGAGLGVFASLTLPAGVRFGPYRGRRTTSVHSQYCWQLYDSRGKPAQAVDGADVGCSNWMRYVNCSRHSREQNLLAFQYRGDIYYRTIRIIPRYTELLVYYGSEFAHKVGIDIRRYNTPIALPNTGIPPFKLDQDTKKSLKSSECKVINNVLDNIPKTPFKYDRKMYVCDDCNTTFNSRKILVRHIRAENVFPHYKGYKTNEKVSQENVVPAAKQCQVADINDKPYECKKCNKSFKQKRSLRTHDKIHTGEGLFQCEICDSKFADSRCLKRHLLIHTGEKQVKCNICNSKFASSVSLNRHIGIHTGEKPYKCNECNYKFTTNHCLKRHMRTHTREKPHKCNICNHEFTGFFHLKQHMMSHTGEKPFECNTCKHRFAKKFNLKRHMIIHTGGDTHHTVDN